MDDKPLVNDQTEESGFGLPVIDLTGDEDRRAIVAEGTTTSWQGHPNTLLLPDGSTILCAWHAADGVEAINGGFGRQNHLHDTSGVKLARSTDAGRTWSPPLDVPASWMTLARGVPTIHRVVDPHGVARLLVFSRDADRSTFLTSVSTDDGRTWSDMQPLGLEDDTTVAMTGWTAPMSLMPVQAGGPGHYRMWFERAAGIDSPALPGTIWQAESRDGGMTWGRQKAVLEHEGAAEPSVVRCPDGRWLMLVRQDTRTTNSLWAISDDEGESWSEPGLLPLPLTGDRHLARVARDGRLVIAFRPVTPGTSRRNEAVDEVGYCTVWIGTLDDILEGRDGQMLVRLARNVVSYDHTYPGLLELADGTYVCTTYIKERPGPTLHSVICVRFTLAELDDAAGRDPMSASSSLEKTLMRKPR